MCVYCLQEQDSPDIALGRKREESLHVEGKDHKDKGQDSNLLMPLVERESRGFVSYIRLEGVDAAGNVCTCMCVCLCVNIEPALSLSLSLSLIHFHFLSLSKIATLL